MAGDTRISRSETDAQTLVADLLRRVTSPEVLAGVAGAAAAARFTKHLVEDSDEAKADEPVGPHETQDGLENEPIDDERAEPSAEEDEADEDEADEDEREEPSADGDESDDEERDETVAEDEEDPEEAGRDAPSAEKEQEPETAADSEPDEGEEAQPEQDPGADESEETGDSSANGSVTDGERMELLDQARKYAVQLTGHPVESFSSLEREDRGWRIGMEVVELSRVPSTTDVLGSYQLVLTDEGELVDFRRGHRYSRNSTDDAS